MANNTHTVKQLVFEYRSNLSSHMNNFIETNRKNGFIYNSHATALKALDSYIVNNPYLDTGTLNEDCVLGFISQYPSDKYSTSYIHGMATYIAKFAMYLISLDIDAYIFPVRQLPKVFNKTPYIPTHEEIMIFFRYIDSFCKNKARKNFIISNKTFCVMLRMVYACGLRISEAINLTRDEVDFNNHSISIIQSKGDKDRILYLRDDLTDLLHRYDDFIAPIQPKRETFFVNCSLGIVNTTSILIWFKNRWRDCFPKSTPETTPCLHSLRHAMVVRTIDLWGGESSPEFNKRLPALSKFLGHTCIKNTLHYYHQLKGYGQAVQKSIDKCNSVAKEVANEITK